MSLGRAFHVGEFNVHYAGEYSGRAMEWRRLGARDKAQNLIQLLGQRTSEVDSVLEAGCGTGAVLNEVARLGLGNTFVGIDLEDPEDHAESHLNSAVTLARYDGKTIPFDDGAFDLVFASHVLEHVDDERGFLRELRRVTRNYVYVEVPCELHLRTTHDNLQRTLNIGHINSYTPKSFALTLQTAGMEILTIELFDHSMDVHAFHTSRARAYLKAAIRKAALKVNEALAAQIFTYHCGALCRAAAP